MLTFDRKIMKKCHSVLTLLESISNFKEPRKLSETFWEDDYYYVFKLCFLG